MSTLKKKKKPSPFWTLELHAMYVKKKRKKENYAFQEISQGMRALLESRNYNSYF